MCCREEISLPHLLPAINFLQVSDYPLNQRSLRVNTAALIQSQNLNGLTVCAVGAMKDAQPYSPQAPVKANVYLFTPTLNG